MEECKEHTIFFSFSWKYFCFFCVFRIILWFFVFSSCAYFADGCFWRVLLRANTQMSLCERHRFHTGTSALIRLYSFYYIIVVFCFFISEVPQELLRWTRQSSLYRKIRSRTILQLQAFSVTSGFFGKSWGWHDVFGKFWDGQQFLQPLGGVIFSSFSGLTWRFPSSRPGYDLFFGVM